MSSEERVRGVLKDLEITSKANLGRLAPFLKSMKMSALNEKELKLIGRVIEEMFESPKGVSDTLEALTREDFIEPMVSMKQFIEDDDYLGEFCKTLYPFWKNVLIDIIDNDKGYLEIALSGAIGIGKTHIGVILMLRALYYLMCLRDPHKYLGVKQTIALVFLNLDLSLAEGVGWDRFNKGALSSPWFLRNGGVEGIKYKRYKPDKDLEAIVASTNDHMIGKDVFCCRGDTIVETERGEIEIGDLALRREEIHKKVKSFNHSKEEAELNSYEGVTHSESNISYIIRTEEGDLEVTGNHQVLTNYGYVRAEELFNMIEIPSGIYIMKI